MFRVQLEIPTRHTAEAPYEIEFDPMGYYASEKVPHIRLAEAIGILPHWLDMNDERSAIEQFEAKYAFGPLTPFKGSRVDEGMYISPFEEDPELYPLAVIRMKDETVWFYQYAMVGIVNNKTQQSIVVRMD